MASRRMTYADGTQLAQTCPFKITRGSSEAPKMRSLSPSTETTSVHLSQSFHHLLRKRLLHPITGEFLYNILCDSLCRCNVGFATGEIARLQLGESSSVQRTREFWI